MKSFAFKTQLWLYPGHSGWVFATIPKKDSITIKKQTIGLKRGWGSVPVTVILGNTTWETSIFPEKISSTYLLPIKARVRKIEEVMEGDRVELHVTIR